MLHNIGVILTLVILEGLLSADNALVLAILVRHLPKELRSRALKYGIFGAFFFRFIAIVFASYMSEMIWFQLVGGLYLLYIAITHFWQKQPDAGPEIKTAIGRGFWHTVFVVELTDIAFSVDSILAAVALAPGQIWVLYTGGVLGIITMRFVAGGFLRILDMYPGLETSAYLLVGWIGIKLTSEGLGNHWLHDHPVVFWGVMAILFGFGFLQKKPVETTGSRAELLHQVEEDAETVDLEKQMPVEVAPGTGNKE